MINDNQALLSATHGAFKVPTYDDGYGPLWVLRDSHGVNAIIRAASFQDAYEIAEDEFFPECDLTIEEVKAEYGFKREHVKIIKPYREAERAATAEDYPRKLINPNSDTDGRHSWEFVRWQTIETPDPEAWHENALFQEGYGFRPNGPNTRDKIGHGIYSKDLNGDYLDLLTPALAEEIGVTLTLEEQ